MNKPSVRAQVVTRRTYNRLMNKEGTVFETWSQTINRVIEHQRWLWERALGGTLTKKQNAELEQLRLLMLERKALVAGRTLWLGGTEVVKRREASMFNCSGLMTRTVHDAVDKFWLLLQGCGVGFVPVSGTLCAFTRKMKVEVIRSTRKDKGGDQNNLETFVDGVWTIRIGDSAESWAKAIGKLVAGKYPATKLVFDLSQIRPAGERLSGYGWICSGDENLSKALPAIAKIMNERAGKLLRQMDILDITNWLGTVLSSRRSAQIALMDWDSPEIESFITAKLGEWWKTNPQRSQSNNSVMFSEHPGIKTFKTLLRAMHATGGGDPGIVNAEEAKRRAPWASTFNPCLTADTWVTTSEGAKRISSLIGTPFKAIVNGVAYDSNGFFQTGVMPVLKVKLLNGTSVRLTGNHKVMVADLSGNRWSEAKDLIVGDGVVLHNHRGLSWGGRGTSDEGYLLGNLVGDGCFGTKSAILDYWGEHREFMANKAVKLVKSTVGSRSDLKGSEQTSRVGKTRVQSASLAVLAKSYGIGRDKVIGDEVESASSEFLCGFLRGWFDADGTVVGNHKKGNSVRLSSVILSNLQLAQRVLARLGIQSKIHENRVEAGYRSLPDGKGGHKDYVCQAGHELCISKSNMEVFHDRVGFTKPDKAIKLSSLLGLFVRKMNKELFNSRIVSISEDGVEPVYDCTVPGPEAFDANGMYVHNCAEIILPDKGFCNLVTVDLNKFHGDHMGLIDAISLIARANYRQTVVNLKDGILQDAWHQQNEYLRLCGVSLTGYRTRPDLTEYDFKQFRNAAICSAYSMADELGLERPKNVTTGKPEGTLSKIMDTLEGCHNPLGKFIFNNIGFNKLDPIVQVLRDANYKVIPHPTDSTSVLACLPVEWPTVEFGNKHYNTESAVSQLERYKTIMNYYVEQNQSVTISYDESELDSIAKWLDKNWNNYVGVSFLRRVDPTKSAADIGYPYLPQEVVTEATYRDYVNRLKPVDIEAVASQSDDSQLAIDTGTECAGGVCPIK
jgi:ribonucleotide reductase, class II